MHLQFVRHHSLPATLIALAALCGLSGCGERMTNVEYGNRNQVLFIGCGAEPSTLDPQQATGMNESYPLLALFEGLTTMDPTNLEVRPAVALSWTVSDDLKTYTFELDPEARWSNGDALTAHDFCFAYERILSPAFGAQYAYILHIIENAAAFNSGELEDFSQVGVKALDDHTLELQLESPTPYFLELLTHYAWYPVHPGTILAHGKMTDKVSTWTKAGNYVGNGPFHMRFWQLNNRIIVEKNPHYRKADEVRLNAIHFMPIDNVDTEERAFRSEYIHLSYTMPVHRKEWYEANYPDRIRFDTFLGTYYYAFNVEHPPLDNPKVRRALALSVDRGALTEFVTRAGEKPAYWFTPPNTNGYTSRSAITYDPAQARQLLAEAGYPDGKGFPKIELLYNTHEAHKAIAVAVQRMWKQELGIEVTLFNQEWKVYLDSRRNGKFDVLRAAWIGDYNDPYTFLGLFASNSENNSSRWTNAAYDALLKKTQGEADPDRRMEYFQQAEAILLDALPIMPIYFYVRKLLIHPSVKGWPPNLLDYHPYQHVYLEADS